MRSPISLEHAKNSALAVYTEFKCFFSTPIFFIVLGCLFLIAAYRLMNETHPSFVFLLSILGISIVLYGTGTHSVGSADFKNVPIRVAVAGGAGVLAAVFGFGIVWQGDKIPEIFKSQRKYGLIQLTNGAKQYDFTKLFMSATSFEGMPLHVLTRSDLLQVVMPLTMFSESVRVCVVALDPTGTRLTKLDNCLDAFLKEPEASNSGEPRDAGSDSAQKAKRKSSANVLTPDRQDFERIYEGMLILNPDGIPKGDNPVYQAQ